MVYQSGVGIIWSSSSQLEVILLHRGHLNTSGDIFSCHNRREGYFWHPVGRGQDAAKHLTRHRTASWPKNDLTHNLNKIAEVKKFCYNLTCLTNEAGNPDSERQRLVQVHTTSWWQSHGEKYPLKSSTAFLPDLKLLTRQRVACYKRWFQWKMTCWHNSPGKPNIMRQIQVYLACCPSVWVIFSLSSQERFQKLRRPSFGTECSPRGLCCSPASLNTFLFLGLQTNDHNYQTEERISFY